MRNMFLDLKRGHLGLVFILVSLLCVGCPWNGPVDPPRSVKEEMTKIVAARTLSENWVSQIKRSQGQINEKQYLESSDLYSQSAGAFNGWLEEIKGAIKMDRGSEAEEQRKEEQREEDLKEALQKGEDFVVYARKLYGLPVDRFTVFSAKGIAYDMISGGLSGIGKIFMDYVNSKREERRRRIQEITQWLDSNMWKTWNEIPEASSKTQEPS